MNDTENKQKNKWTPKQTSPPQMWKKLRLVREYNVRLNIPSTLNWPHLKKPTDFSLRKARGPAEFQVDL